MQSSRTALPAVEETFIHNWQKTEWAEGMMEAVHADYTERFESRGGALLDSLNCLAVEDGSVAP